MSASAQHNTSYHRLQEEDNDTSYASDDKAHDLEPHDDWHGTAYSTQSQSRLSKALPYRTLLVLCSITTVISIVLGIVMAVGSQQFSEHYAFGPQLRIRPKIFESEPYYSAPPTPKTDAAWDRLMPAGRGFVLIPNPERYGLPPGIPTEVGTDRYSVAVFHQLHCLGMIRSSYFAALAGRDFVAYGEDRFKNPAPKPKHDHSHSHSDESTENEDSNFQHAHSNHIGHCFDYLRQALQCSADMTIEAPHLEPDGVTRARVNGWGIQHDQCKDWYQVMNWMSEHAAPHNYSGIA